MNAREAGGGEVGGVRVERGAGGLAEEYGTLVRVEGGWGGKGDVERVLDSAHRYRP